MTVSHSARLVKRWSSGADAPPMRLTRRTALLAAASATVAPLLALVRAEAGAPQLRVTGFELPIHARLRTVWLIPRCEAVPNPDVTVRRSQAQAHERFAEEFHP